MNKTIIIVGSIIFGAAALLDLKYKGLGYKMLPHSIQEKVNRIM